jgi:dienelactone hydrolase
MNAQADPVDAFLVRNLDLGNNGSIEVPGRLLVPPGYTNSQSYPLVVNFHGIGQRGSDNAKQVNEEIGELITKANARGFFLYAPQLPSDHGNWDNAYVDNVMRSVAAIARDYNIDPAKIYVTGLSLGGGGVKYSIGHYTGALGAAVSICGVGGGNSSELPNLVGKPIWLYHGTADLSVDVSTSRNYLNSIRALDPGKDQLTFRLNVVGNPHYNIGEPYYAFWQDHTYFEDHGLRYSEFGGASHFIWGEVFQQNFLYDWLLVQTADSALKSQESALFDFGTTAPPTTDSQGRRWNSVQETGAQSTLSAVIPFAQESATGRRTSVSVSVLQPFAGVVPTTSGVSNPQFHDNVAKDGWITAAGATEATAGKLRIHGLVPNALYRLEIFAGHVDNDGGLTRTSRYKVINATVTGSDTADLNAYNNTANSASALAIFPQITANASGSFDLLVYPSPATAARYGQINAINLKRLDGTGTPVNQAPQVNAGPDQTITLPSTASLNGTVTDDGLPNATVTKQWVKVTGPSTVTFGNAANPITTATFSVAGTYVLQLSGTDAAPLSTSDQVTITVNAAPPAGGGTVLFDQSFTSSTTLSSYINATAPTANQFNDISAGTNGGTWSIVNNALQLDRPATTDSGPAGFTRHTNLPGSPSVALMEFDLKLGGVFNMWSPMMAMTFGDMTTVGVYNDVQSYPNTTASLILQGNGNGNFRLRLTDQSPLYSPSYAIGTNLHIAWYLNTSGVSKTFTGPDSVSRTLLDKQAMLYVNNVAVVQPVGFTTSYQSRSLSDFRLYSSSTPSLTATFDNFKVTDLSSPANQAPVAVANTATTNEATAVTVNVLANDSDPDSGPSALTIQSVGTPTNGTAQIVSGQVVYTPNPGFYGTTDTFPYTITDGAATATANVTVTVNSTSTASNLNAAGLTGSNIGTSAGGSSRVLANGSWEVNGSGSGLAAAADSFHYESSSIDGDFQVIAKVNSLTSTGAAPRAGVMIRETTAAGSRFVAIATTTTGATTPYRLIKRDTVNVAGTDTVTTGFNYSYPNGWVILERVGNVINVGVSADGVTFTTVNSVTLSGLASTVTAGVFSSSGTVGANARAVVTDFALLPTTIFSQNFDSSSTLSTYINAGTAGAGQFNDISAVANGGTWSIASGALQLARPLTTDTAAAGFTRHTDLPANPAVAVMEFDFKLTGAFNNWNPMMAFAFGDMASVGTYTDVISYSGTTAALTVQGNGSGSYKFRLRNGVTGNPAKMSQAYSFGTSVHVAWYTNTSNAPQTFIGPDGASHTLPDLHSALFVNNVMQIDDETQTVGYQSRSLKDFRFFSNSTPSINLTIDNLQIFDSF